MIGMGSFEKLCYNNLNFFVWYSLISIFFRPDKGVITLDLYTCGPTSLLPIVPLAKQLFAIPKAKTDTTESDDDDRSTLPKMVYAHKFRGFGHDDTDASELSDMLHFPVGQMSDFKIEVCLLVCALFLCVFACMRCFWVYIYANEWVVFPDIFRHPKSN